MATAPTTTSRPAAAGPFRASGKQRLWTKSDKPLATQSANKHVRNRSLFVCVYLCRTSTSYTNITSIARLTHTNKRKVAGAICWYNSFKLSAKDVRKTTLRRLTVGRDMHYAGRTVSAISQYHPLTALRHRVRWSSEFHGLEPAVSYSVGNGRPLLLHNLP